MQARLRRCSSICVQVTYTSRIDLRHHVGSKTPVLRPVVLPAGCRAAAPIICWMMLPMGSQDRCCWLNVARSHKYSSSMHMYSSRCAWIKCLGSAIAVLCGCFDGESSFISAGDGQEDTGVKEQYCLLWQPISVPFILPVLGPHPAVGY